MGGLFAPQVAQLAKGLKAKTILDYGCGKRHLEKELNQIWRMAPVCEIVNYDPCIEGLDDRSLLKPCDLVVCTDVMEHIEPDLVDNVLDDIASLTLRAVFFSIANRPASRVLSDGRNAHLIQKPPLWWMSKLSTRFRIKAFENMDSLDDRGFWFVCDHPKK